MSKVFCIGMFKTGTTSIGHALEILGYNTYHGPWFSDDLLQDPWNENIDEWDKYHDVIKSKINNYDAFEDYPWMFLYKKIDNWFPQSKFILTVRNPEEVAQSDINMWKKSGAADEAIPPKEKFIKRYINHLRDVKEYFKNKENLLIIDLSKDEDPWDKISSFLNKKKPGVEFPHANKGNYKRITFFDHLIRKIYVYLRKIRLY